MEDENEPRKAAEGRGRLAHEELTGRIIETFYEVHHELGHGFLESVYCRAMCIALAEKGLKTSYEERIPVWFREQDVGPFRADIVVDETVILELLAGRAIDSAHEAKLLNYLRATDKEVGFVMNFGVKATFKRLVFDNSRKLAIPRCGVRGLPRPSAASRPSVA